MQSLGESFEAGRDFEDGIAFLDDASVELIEEPPHDLESVETRVWIRPYAAR